MQVRDGNASKTWIQWIHKNEEVSGSANGNSTTKSWFCNAQKMRPKLENDHFKLGHVQPRSRSQDVSETCKHLIWSNLHDFGIRCFVCEQISQLSTNISWHQRLGKIFQFLEQTWSFLHANLRGTPPNATSPENNALLGIRPHFLKGGIRGYPQIPMHF